jgi:pimeloyl-ACP methyl ester carboxylesterase
VFMEGVPALPDLTAGNLRFHYVSAPSAPRRPAIVLLHGAGANHTVWLAQMKALRDRAWVVLPDLPGHGKSAAIPGETIDEYAAAMIPFLESIAAASDRIFLGGHSMGSAIALMIALARPDLVAGLVLVGGGAKLGVSPEILKGLIEAPIETQALVARWSFAKSADPELIRRTMRDLAGAPAGRALTDFRACNGFDVRSRLSEIASPVLIVCGREDNMTPPKYGEYLQAHLPNASLRIFEEAGHAVMVEKPAEVSEAIASFLESPASS